MNQPFVKDGLYHAETGIPWHLFQHMAPRPVGLEYGPHARKAALDDRFGQLTSVPLSHSFLKSEVFEVEVEQGCIVKFCARLSSGFGVRTNAFHSHDSDEIDLVLVCMRSTREPSNLFVKTLWLNLRSDNHATLDKSKYIAYTE